MIDTKRANGDIKHPIPRRSNRSNRFIEDDEITLSKTLSKEDSSGDEEINTASEPESESESESESDTNEDYSNKRYIRASK